jgi:phage shock protein PspC (stress-responsive transcriptional regulator)
MTDSSSTPGGGVPLAPPPDPFGSATNGAPPPPEPLRWARVDDDKFIGGVCGGLGRALGVDSNWVRIAFVALLVFSGFGFPAYIALWLALPETPAGPPTSSGRRIAATVLGLIALSAGFGWDDNPAGWAGGGAWALAIALLVVAVVLLRGPKGVDSEPSTTPAPWGERLERAGTRVEEAASRFERNVEQWDRDRSARAKQRRRNRSKLGWVGLGLAAVVGAIVWMASSDRSDQGQLAFAAATVTMGAVVVLSTFFGRAKWLVVPASCTLVAAVGASTLDYADASLTAGSSSLEYVVGTDELASEYRSGTGDITLTIFDETLPTSPVTAATSVTLGGGDLYISVPETAALTVTARIGAGSVYLPGRSVDGFRRTVTYERPASVTSAGTIDPRRIELTLSLAIGEINVENLGDEFVPVPEVPDPVVDVPEPVGPLIRNFSDGSQLFDDGTVFVPEGVVYPDGRVEGTIVEQRADGSLVMDGGTVIKADGTIITMGGFRITAEERGLGDTAATTAPVPTTSPTTTISTTTGTETQP